MMLKRYRSLFFLGPLSCLLLIGLSATGCGSDSATLAAGPGPDSMVVRLQQPEAETTAADKSASPPTPTVGGVVTARVRATVNGKPILDDELREIVWQELRVTEQLPEPKRSAVQSEILKQGLDQLIEREVIINDAEERLQKKDSVWRELRSFAEKEFEKQLRGMRQRSGAETDEDLKEILQAQGLTMANLKRRIERSFLANEYMRSRIFPKIEQIGHKEIRQYYNEHPGEFQNDDRVKWQDIFIDAGSSKFASRGEARQLADSIVARAQAGEDFIRLSSQYDQGDSMAYRNGDGAGQKRGEIKPIEVESLLFDMKEGQVVVVELPTGFHVVRVAKREYAGPQPFDEKTQNDVRKKLQNIIADREYKVIVNDLKRKATIQIFISE